jgi:hypothetical protein
MLLSRWFFYTGMPIPVAAVFAGLPGGRAATRVRSSFTGSVKNVNQPLLQWVRRRFTFPIVIGGKLRTSSRDHDL